MTESHGSVGGSIQGRASEQTAELPKLKVLGFLISRRIHPLLEGVTDMTRKQNVKNEIDTALALIGQMKDLLDVWGREDYRQNLYPLDAFENKDWKKMIELLNEFCHQTLVVDTDFRKESSHSHLKESGEATE